MTRNSVLSVLPSFLFAISCLVGSNPAQAQLASDASGTGGTYSPFTSSTSAPKSPRANGRFTSDSSVLMGESELDLASSMGTTTPSSENANSAKTNMTEGSSTSRAAWLAGANNMGPSSTSGWKAGFGSFDTANGTSWVAGASSFSVGRQPDGIWRAMQTSGVPSQMTTQTSALSSFSSSSGPRHFATGLTAKGAAAVKAGRSSSPLAAHLGTGSGAPHGFGGTRNSWAPRAGAFRGFGNRSGTDSTKHLPAPGTQIGPALDETLHSGHNSKSPGTLGSELDDGTLSSH